MVRAVLGAFSVAILLSGCADAAPLSPGGAGIRGVVLSGPQCPVQTVDDPCPDSPVPDITVRVTALDGAVAGQPRTDGEGRFELPVAAGDYMLQPVIEHGEGMFAKPQQVTVSPGSFVEVTLRLDTGIR